MKNKNQSILSIVFSLIAASGCGDYVTKPDFESADASRQAEIVALQARIDTLEAVFVSDVILNTESRTESGKWPKFDGTIDLDATWRFLEAGSTRVNGGYTITWTNNTNSDITVNYRLVF